MSNGLTQDRGEWLQTFTGRAFFIQDPRPEDINIRDIAHHLAYSSRFNGATSRFYSIAEHSIAVSIACDPEHELEGLLHDAAEAYLGDVVRPLKKLLPDYKRIEVALEVVIAAKYSLVYPWPASVDRADLAVLAAERRDLMRPAPISWQARETVTPFPSQVGCMSSREAEEAFLHRFATSIARRG